MLTIQQKQLLYFGWTRSNYTEYSKIPSDLLSSFTHWYSDALLNVVIEGDDILKFRELSKAMGEPFGKYMIKLSDNISLECSLQPRGYLPSNKNWKPGLDHPNIAWLFKGISNNKCIQEFTFYFECGCDQIPNSINRNTTFLEPMEHYSSQYDSVRMAPISLFMEHDKLSFYVYIELINYKLNNGNVGSDLITKYVTELPIYDSPSINYKWILRGKELKNFLDLKPRQTMYSPNFMNNCIGIGVEAYGNDNDTSHDQIGIFIRFYKIPQDITPIIAPVWKTNILANNDNKSENSHWRRYEDIMIYDTSGIDPVGMNGFSLHISFNNMDTDMFRNKESELVIEIQIDIVKVYAGDYCNNPMTVDRKDWYKYGIGVKDNVIANEINNRYIGVCKKFDRSKGFGFITMNDGSNDIFVHYSEIQAKGYKYLAVGKCVAFEIVVQDDGKRKAINVTEPNGAAIAY